MKLQVNGKMFELQGKTAADLIQQLGYANSRIAVEVNEQIIAQSKHHKFCLNTGDKIEIIKAVGGG